MAPPRRKATPEHALFDGAVTSSVRGRLVVEDEYLLAEDPQTSLED